jgi:hypothetical protein
LDVKRLDIIRLLVTTQHRAELPSGVSVCERVKQLGYYTSKTFKLYGEEYEGLSDPFMDGNNVALHVRTKQRAEIRTLRLPSTILQSAFKVVLNRAS